MPADSQQPGSKEHQADKPSAMSRSDEMPEPDPPVGRTETSAQQRAKRIVPWLVSFAVHAGIVFLGFVMTWTVVQMAGDQEGALVTADADIVTFEPVMPDETEVTEDDAEMVDDLDLMPSDLPADELFVDIDPAPEGLAPEMPAAGNPADFSPPPVQGSVSFMGLSTNEAQRIVYIIDASGRMIPYLQFVIEELARSLASLGPQQEFGVVFIQRDEAVIVPPRRLVPAGASERFRALEWIDRNIVPAGRSNPVAAFEAALQMNPDAVFVLSGNITGAGIYEVDQDDLLARIDQLNPVQRRTGERRTIINCIQFLDPDPLGTLVKIAEAHGGDNGYKFISRRELGLASP